MQFTASLIAGLALGLLNWVFWTRWGKKLEKQKESRQENFVQRTKENCRDSHAGLVVIGLLKIGILGGIIWLLLNKAYVTPGGFLIGFGMVVLFIILKGFAWK
ncbi:MAG: hypothetical protein HY877_04345 [Deltaproteobacteria bacterium]|nr:hypothetical protein [Deltaproteobacteria bacterium]